MADLGYHPAPEGEENRAYNGDGFRRTEQDVLSGWEAGRISKLPQWARASMLGLVQRIYNLRRIVAERDADNERLRAALRSIELNVDAVGGGAHPGTALVQIKGKARAALEQGESDG